eukprot:6123551-Amphidinium_carterae.1
MPRHRTEIVYIAATVDATQLLANPQLKRLTLIYDQRRSSKTTNYNLAQHQVWNGDKLCI